MYVVFQSNCHSFVNFECRLPSILNMTLSHNMPSKCFWPQKYVLYLELVFCLSWEREVSSSGVFQGL